MLTVRDDVQVAPLSADLAPRLYAWVCDPEVARNLGLRSRPSLAKTEAWLAKALADEAARPFAIQLEGVCVGAVVLDLIDRHLGTARLFCYVGEPSARRAGVGTAGVYRCLVEAFGQLDLNKVWLTVHAFNSPAIAAYARLGFQLEGVLREEFMLDGGLVTALRMGVLRREFQQLAIGDRPEAPA